MKKNAETKAVPQLPTLEELKAELKREKYKARSGKVFRSTVGTLIVGDRFKVCVNSEN